MRARTALAAFFALVVAAAVGAAQPTPSSALVVRTWTGAGADALWSNAANWDTGVPAPGDAVVFPPGAGSLTSEDDLAPDLAFASITFTGSGYTLSGNPLQLSGALLSTASGFNTVALSLGGAGSVRVESGTLALAAANSFSGPAEVAGGTLRVAHGAALGTDSAGVTVSLGAVLALTGSIDLGDEPIVVEGEGLGGYGAVRSLSGANRAGEVHLAAATTVGVDGGTLAIGHLAGASPAAGLTLVGGGKLRVETGLFAGPLHAVEGNLTWDAASSGPATIEYDGWLRGTGTVGAIDADHALVWPGSGSLTGILSTTGDATLRGGAFKTVVRGTTAGTGYGQLAVDGIVHLAGPALDLELEYVPAPGDTFVIIRNNGSEATAGSFAGLAEGATFPFEGYSWQVSYRGGTGNDVTLTVLRRAEADLRAAITVEPPGSTPPGTLIYTLRMTNDGPDTATSPRFSMGIPAGTSFASVTAPGHTCVTPPTPGRSVTCIGQPLAAGGTREIMVTVQVDAGAAGPIVATVAVLSATSDPASADNTATITTPLAGPGTLAFRRFLPGLSADSGSLGPFE